VHWIDRYFRECILTTGQVIGFSLGLLSTVIWAYAQIPQVVLNFRNRSVAGLSPVFVTMIVVGDLCNLVGIVVEGGLATQVIAASWFLLCDSTCFLQWVYYACVRPRCFPRPRAIPAPAILPALGVPLLAPLAAAGSGPYEPPQLWGTFLGWASALCYLSSRYPQISENYRRQTTEGVSSQYFLSAIFGNISYAMSIFLQDSSWPFVWKQFPWLAGSLGNLVFDFALIAQFIRYRKNKPKELGFNEVPGCGSPETDSGLESCVH
jgi:uncharacterized protein with PQ loop repeat